ncbi:TolC family protein [Flavobacterium sp.]|uniref:TolC family protein n=1 Tax=Flavobacterium sp. TaxID=239 RepID=UPI003F6A069A
MKYKARYALILLFLICFSFSSKAQTTLTFEKCLEIAFENNLRIKNAEISEKITQYQHKSAITKLLPDITGSASNNYSWGRGIDPSTNSFVDQEFKSYSGGFNTGLNLFSGFKNINSIKLAKQELEENKTTIQKLKNEITIEIATKYTNILYLEEIIKSNEEQIKSTQKQLELNQSKFELGYIPESDIFKIKSQLANEQLTLINNTNLLSLNDLELKQLLNIPYSQNLILIPIEEKLFSKLNLDTKNESIINSAVEQNPEFKLSLINQKKSKINLALSRALFFPSLNASFGVNSAYSNNNLLFDFNQQLKNNLSYGLSFSLSIPLFSQFQNHFKVKENKLNYKQAFIDTEIERNRLSKVVIQALNDANASFSKYESSLSALEYSKKSYEADVLKLELGKISTNEFINTKNIFINNQAELIRSKYELMFNQSLVSFYMNNKFEF